MAIDLTTVLYILGLCTLGSFVGLIGGFVLLWKEHLARKLAYFFVSFAAGVLLGAVFFDLLPEALELGEACVWGAVIAALVTFSITERALVWHSHHNEHKEFHPKVKPYGFILMLGDTVHNFTDGVIIATTTLISVPLGLLTAIAVFCHEVPQEIGDFGALLAARWPRKKIISYNVLSASATFFGAFTILGFARVLQAYLPLLLAFAAGGFIYIAVSDLIPELKHEARKWQHIVAQTAIMIVGIVLIAALGALLGAH